jgi:hypothetical protein
MTPATLPQKRILVLSTVAIVLLAIAAVVNLPSNEYSALGDLFSAVGSIIAVLWFSAALFYQSKQLEEQREQFQAEFKHVRAGARRDALSVCKDILREAESRALTVIPEVKTLPDLITTYSQFYRQYSVLMVSTDAEQVQEVSKMWMAKEAPTGILLAAIKRAAEIYFTAVDKDDIDYLKEADEFVLFYGSQLWKLPYFEEYAYIAEILSDMRIRLQAERKAVYLASII